jgi:signal transduction histidine kinase/FixJ family two-component response regulator
MTTPICVLILEDRADDAELMLHELRRAGFEPEWRRVQSEADYLVQLEPPPEVILADYTLPQWDALRALQLLQERNMDIPLIVVTGTISEEAAVECMKQGAADYILKDRMARLGQAVVHALEEKRLRMERKLADEALKKYTDRLEILRQIDQAILAAQSPEEIAKATLGHIRRLVPCLRANLMLLDFEAQVATVLLVDTDRKTGFGTGKYLPLNTYTTGDELWEGKVHIVDDIQSLSDPSPLEQALLTEGMTSYISVPLLIQDDLIGTLDLWGTGVDAFSDEDIDIARDVAGSLAVALHQARLFEQVRAGRNRLQILSQELVELQETEKRHLARELHDEIGQLLTGLKLVLEMSTRLPLESAKVNIEEALAMVSNLMARVRDLSLDLRPAMLDDLGLLPALLWYFERYTVRTHVSVDFSHYGLEGQRFPSEIETASYRIVQEALTNIARHAGVKETTLRLWVDQQVLNVKIEDAGAGFDPKSVLAANATSGLIGMHERAVLLGGRLTVESSPGEGTRLTAELPLRGWLERRKKPRLA